MTPAPETGRTAEDLLDDLDHANTVAEPQRCADIMDEARLAIMALQADLIAARKERDEARADRVWADMTLDVAQEQREQFREMLGAAETEAASLRLRLQEAEKGDDFLREVLESVAARWREAAMMAVGGDMRRLQRLLDAKPIAGSAALNPNQEAGDHEPR